MADFSIQDAAFSGFRVVREHRGYLFIWAGLALILSLVLTAAIIIIAGPAMTSLQALSATGVRDPATVLPLLGRLAPLYLVMIPVSLVFYGVLCAAMNRAILRPADTRFAYLALGADEFRQIALLLLGFTFFAGVYVLLVIGMVIAAVLLNSVTHAPPALMGLLAVMIAFTAMIWLAVRLSLASALTFQRGRVSLFSSWALTKGRFSSILGAYVLVFALTAVIVLLTWLVILAIMAIATGGNLSKALEPPDMRSLAGYFTIAQFVQTVLNAGVSALLWPVVLTPPAAILRQLSIGNAIVKRGFT